MKKKSKNKKKLKMKKTCCYNFVLLELWRRLLGIYGTRIHLKDGRVNMEYKLRQYTLYTNTYGIHTEVVHTTH